MYTKIKVEGKINPLGKIRLRTDNSFEVKKVNDIDKILVYKERICQNVDRLTEKIVDICRLKSGLTIDEIVKRLSNDHKAHYIKRRVHSLVTAGILRKKRILDLRRKSRTPRWCRLPSSMWNLIPDAPSIKKISVVPYKYEDVNPLILLRWKHRLKKVYKNSEIIFDYVYNKSQKFKSRDANDLLILIAQDLNNLEDLFLLGKYLFSRSKYKLISSVYETSLELNFPLLFYLFRKKVNHFFKKYRVVIEHFIINIIAQIYFLLSFKRFKRREKRKKILFAFPGAVGDIITISPLIKALREKYKNAWIIFAAGCSNHSNLEFCPYINEVIYYDDGMFRERKTMNWRTVYKFVLKLKSRGRYDKIISIISNWPTRGKNWPEWNMYLINSLEANEKLGISSFHSNPRKSVFTTFIKPESKYMIDKWEEALRLLNIVNFNKQTEIWYDPKSDSYIKEFLKQKNIPYKKLLIGIFPGAGSGNIKRWSEVKFARLADLLVDRHDAFVFVTGGENDRFFCEEVAYYMNNKCEIFCEEPISKTMALMDKLDIIITNDSGPMHIAAALKKPTVAIFGPSSSRTWAPRVKYVEIIEKELCMPCGNYFYCALGKRICVDSISLDEVYEAAARLINNLCSLKLAKNDAI